ncbi:quinone oxidoreductase family protein [Leifsonia aquatica]|uniref:quinone oxidoreductase family protein n=1 Tax=Leifsonia aquatica TaxID=144185 RepID=UPI000469CB08|nr:zinc-binding dehydrogenase [Leifsonia aquatica]
MADRRAIQVSRFGDASALVLAEESLRPPRGTEVVVRVTHASVGATDLLARRGGYVFQPLPGFTPGYDLVGVLETESAVSVALGLRTGDRVAGVLPRMGAHATRLVLSPTFLVAVPDGLDSAVAATAPLDAVTAALALRLGGGGRRVLVQGASGAVGSLAVQLAVQEGRTVVGTASSRTRTRAEALGVPVIDYHAADWVGQARRAADGAFDVAIDHTGAPQVRQALAPDGVLVHTAFAGRPGHERTDALRGSAAAMRRRQGRPRERVCSVPYAVLTRRPQYRALLGGLLAAIDGGRLHPAEPDVYAFDDLWNAERAAEGVAPGRKVVLAV